METTLNLAIDHTILKADTTLADIERICNEAKQYQFKSVCVPPSFVNHTSELLKDSVVEVCTVVGFPLGYAETSIKVAETIIAIDQGATEIDMVIAIGRLKAGDYDYVQNEIQVVYEACKNHGNKLLKVIIETALLTTEEIIKVCKICAEIGVDYVKTSTGFSSSGAKIEDIELMRANLPQQIQIKASGGIKTKDFALALLNAGASRLGCSSSVQIINQ